MLRRRQPLKSSAGTQWPTSVRQHVAAHQPYCLGPQIGMPGVCVGDSQLDHVRAGGTSMKSRSIATNGARLCAQHHERKTKEGRTWRPLLLEAIARLHGACAPCQREAIEVWGAPLEEVAA